MNNHNVGGLIEGQDKAFDIIAERGFDLQFATLRKVPPRAPSALHGGRTSDPGSTSSPSVSALLRRGRPCRTAPRVEAEQTSGSGVHPSDAAAALA